MSWLDKVLSPISAVVKPIVGYMEKGREIKAAKEIRRDELDKLSHEANLKSIERGEISNARMDENANRRIAWADDLTLILLLSAYGFAFYPPALPHIKAGFAAIKEFPPEAHYVLGMMLVSIWGYRRLVEPLIKFAIARFASKIPTLRN